MRFAVILKSLSPRTTHARYEPLPSTAVADDPVTRTHTNYTRAAHDAARTMSTPGPRHGLPTPGPATPSHATACEGRRGWRLAILAGARGCRRLPPSTGPPQPAPRWSGHSIKPYLHRAWCRPRHGTSLRRTCISLRSCWIPTPGGSHIVIRSSIAAVHGLDYLAQAAAATAQEPLLLPARLHHRRHGCTAYFFRICITVSDHRA